MIDMEARRVVEALRSGVPSRAVGRYFSEARPEIMRTVQNGLDNVCENGVSGGMIITGKYGEGKTHLLNTIFSMASDNRMAVSYISLGKESPFDKLYLVYQKLMANTYLPGREQPGFMYRLEELTPNSAQAKDLLLFASRELQTEKIYYVLECYLNTEDQEEKFQLQADLEGDFIPNATLKKIYRRIFQKPAKFMKPSFTKTKHTQDYYAFISHLFRVLGCSGWSILADEAELMGRLGKKARLKCYWNMHRFLVPEKDPETGKPWGQGRGTEEIASSGVNNTFSVFAFSASYDEDVLEGKGELENLERTFPDDPDVIHTIISMIQKAPQLQPLTRGEIRQVLSRIQSFHGRAYGWTPGVSEDSLAKTADSSGYLLRTKLRAVIEMLDQLYQYGSFGNIEVNALGQETYESDDTPELEDVP